MLARKKVHDYQPIAHRPLGLQIKRMLVVFCIVLFISLSNYTIGFVCTFCFRSEIDGKNAKRDILLCYLFDQFWTK